MLDPMPTGATFAQRRLLPMPESMVMSMAILLTAWLWILAMGLRRNGIDRSTRAMLKTSGLRMDRLPGPASIATMFNTCGCDHCCVY